MKSKKSRILIDPWKQAWHYYFRTSSFAFFFVERCCSLKHNLVFLSVFYIIHGIIRCFYEIQCKILYIWTYLDTSKQIFWYFRKKQTKQHILILHRRRNQTFCFWTLFFWSSWPPANDQKQTQRVIYIYV